MFFLFQILLCVYLCRPEPVCGDVRLRLLRLFGKKTHDHFYDSTHGWTNNVVEILQREVSWTRVREIVLQNDPALFRPKSKKMTGNSTATFNVVTSQARKNTKCSSDLFFLKTNIDNGVHVSSRLIFFLSVVNNFFLVLSVVGSFFALCRQSVNPIHTLLLEQVSTT